MQLFTVQFFPHPPIDLSFLGPCIYLSTPLSNMVTSDLPLMLDT